MVDEPPAPAVPGRIGRRALLLGGGSLAAAIVGGLGAGGAGAGPQLRVEPLGPAPVQRSGPLDLGLGWDDTKDPCVVRFRDRWALLGTAGRRGAGRWEVLRAEADDLAGPWRELAPARLDLPSGRGVAAPGVVVDGDALELFIQTEYAHLGGTIEHLRSLDGGATFTRVGSALVSDPATGEAGIYDPEPAAIGDDRYLVYSAMRRARSPDLHLARSVTGSWAGPWERLGPILVHGEVPFHNRRDREGYEWGLEGGQLVPLPGGGVLLLAVCFLSGGRPGTRQRLFLATAPEVRGPYRLGTALAPVAGSWEAGENGHASGVVVDDRLCVVYQARAGRRGSWRYGLAAFELRDIAGWAAPRLGLR